MSITQVAIRSAGLVTSVGLDTASSCAAMRCRLNNFEALGFIDQEHVPLVGAAVPWGGMGPGVRKLAQMALAAMRQALAAEPDVLLADTPILLCVAEAQRGGRLAQLDTGLAAELERLLGHALHPDSQVLAEGQTGVASALALAQSLLLERGRAAVLVLAADTFLNRSSIQYYLEQRRLLGSDVPAGFIPGEGAGALLVQRIDDARACELRLYGHGMAHEPATLASDLPLRSDGLVEAVTMALADAQTDAGDVALCIADVNGERYRFNEVALAQTRTGIPMALWLPAESVGETGSLAGCLQYAWLLEAKKKQYLRAHLTILLAGNDSGLRTAQVLAFAYSEARRQASASTPMPFKKHIYRGGRDGA